MGLLAFRGRIVSHHLKLAKLEKQLLTNIIYPRKKSWKGKAVVPVNERAGKQHFIEKSNRKRCTVCPNRPRTWCPTFRVCLCIEPCSKAFHKI